MELSKDNLKAFGGLVLHGGINCLIASANIASGGAASVVAGLANSITGNLASNHIAVLGNKSFENLAERLSNPGIDKVNHDLERLSGNQQCVPLIQKAFAKKGLIARLFVLT